MLEKINLTVGPSIALKTLLVMPMKLSCGDDLLESSIVSKLKYFHYPRVFHKYLMISTNLADFPLPWELHELCGSHYMFFSNMMSILTRYVEIEPAINTSTIHTNKEYIHYLEIFPSCIIYFSIHNVSQCFPQKKQCEYF